MYMDILIRLHTIYIPFTLVNSIFNLYYDIRVNTLFSVWQQIIIYYLDLLYLLLLHFVCFYFLLISVSAVSDAAAARPAGNLSSTTTPQNCLTKCIPSESDSRMKRQAGGLQGCEAGRQKMCEWDKLGKNIIYFVCFHPFPIHFSKSNKHTSIMGGLVDDVALAVDGVGDG